MARHGAAFEENVSRTMCLRHVRFSFEAADEFVNAEGLPPDISGQTLHCGKLPVAHQEGPRAKRCLTMFWCLRKCVVNTEDSLLHI